MRPHYAIFGVLVFLLQFSIPTSAKEDPSWSENYITDLKCDEIKSLKNKNATDPELRKLLEQERMYIPLISKYGLNSFSQLARNRSIKSDSEASQACLNYKRLPSSSNTQVKEKVREFEKKNIRVTCDTGNLSHITCVNDETNEDQFQYETIQYTDGEEIILYTICWPTGYAGWHVLSKKKTLSFRQKLFVLVTKVKAMGFDPRKYFEIPFDDC